MPHLQKDPFLFLKYLMSLTTGTELDRDYRILQMAGQGAFGTVYKAEAVTTRELVAIKQLDYSDFSDSERDAMRQELDVMPLLSHPHIVNYKAVVMDTRNQRAYIVMEFCEGGELSEFIRMHKNKRTKIHEEIIWKFIAQLASALNYMHSPFKKNSTVSGKIMHRDLKPQNIMLTKTGDCKICDFNMCRSVQTARAKTLAGTLAYLAPDVCSNVGYTEKADMWSLGCIIYQMCEYSLPFYWNGIEDIHKDLKDIQYKPISSDYSNDMKGVVSSLLVLDPALRYSASDLLSHPRVSRYLPDQTASSQQHAHCSPPTIAAPPPISDIMAPCPIYESDSPAPAPVLNIHPPPPNPSAFCGPGSVGHQQPSYKPPTKQQAPVVTGPRSLQNAGVIKTPAYKPPKRL
ncbi:Serine/threonine protein kinase [Giardia duodenalis]|uniref:non-specific serine/threonine protein kinase n=1 Tax=Giardia intestinalis TaxID=5741 RepID=V6TG72_GIAIN|nr:Serine/threonine protein kinase [Giardia intestinalis]